MYKTDLYLTDEERLRFNEIVFYNFIKELMLLNPNPIKTFNLIENICDLGGVSVPVITSVVKIVMSEDRRFVPSPEECAHLMRKAQVPVRAVCSECHMSQRTYYAIKKRLKYVECVPKFDARQYDCMMQFLDIFSSLLQPLERRTL